ncbi:MAG: acetyltransferase [Kordiimonadaceae bacterium]|nr:acetyltransferase [Kordiimonadaceae bacterium]
MNKKIIILGVGGNCIDILDTVISINEKEDREVYSCMGFLDDDKETWEKEIHGVKVLGALDTAPNYEDCYFVNGIGSPLNFFTKRDIISKTKIPLDRFETIVHPSAEISRMSHLGLGAVILQSVTIASDVTIGNHVMVLPNSIVGHGDTISDYVTIAGGVCVSGGVSIGRSCYIGANASIIGNITIGEMCLVGMGSVVIDSVGKNSLVAGNPAKFLSNTIEM